jgi:hypothetical protein
MLVTLPSDDLVHRCIVNAVTACQINAPYSSIVLSAKKEDLLIRKPGASVAPRDAAACFHGAPPSFSPTHTAVTRFAVKSVVLLRAGVQMERITACPNIARVKNTFTRLQFAVRQFVGDSISALRFAGDFDVSVSVRLGSLPQRASVRASATVHLRPETCNEIRGILGAHHGVPPVMPCRGRSSAARHFHAPIITQKSTILAGTEGR